MVVYHLKYDLRPEKMEDFIAWAKDTAIPRILDIPGLVEFSSYRTITGSHQIATLYTFSDAAAVAAWVAHPDFEKLVADLRSYATNVTAELWGPSPVVPAPLHPKH